MPEVKLDIPSNSRFASSLNEIDMAMREALIYQMRIADPRTKSRSPKDVATEEENNWLWDKSRVFHVDDLTTEEVFDTYLLRKNINDEKNTDVSYPLLAFHQDDIETVFWGKGQRFAQWDVNIEPSENTWEVGEEVAIIKPGKYRGYRAYIDSVNEVSKTLYFSLQLNGNVIKEQNSFGKMEPVYFTKNDLKPISEKKGSQFRAKAITCKYSCIILADNRDELQYIRDHYMLRVADFKGIWWRYNSPTIQGEENQIFTVFDIPNIERYPSSTDKLKGHGYIYGAAFRVDTWATLTDTPIPQDIIETIRMNLHVERDGRVNRIVVS